MLELEPRISLFSDIEFGAAMIRAWRICISIVFLSSTLACSQHHSVSTTIVGPAAQAHTTKYDPEKILASTTGPTTLRLIP